MNGKRRTRISKFLSLVLRHQPEQIGIALDPQGWTSVETLLEQSARHGLPFTRAELEDVVTTSDKQRFAFSPDGTRVRANQGHSVPVELGLARAVPPEWLYHGTVAAALPGIRAAGLLKQSRHHVHLSPDTATATKVGERRGRPMVLRVHAGRMHADGFAFFVSANGVWLTEHVPAEYIDFPA